ncbi:alpha/beta hydrolase family protein [Rhodococcus sp. MTM3W5.2]|uniref:acetylxylan esterase n=1 Tax=Rhodococcus sp. MTM3W5.2 TaxID=1805827 RepID=UPI0009792F8A|nr:acetylxylan esterase [Rhodococcus sp. MTM3W5.2]AQA20741.1 alpha/beta hydrolase family protein [Rhodococcus sp. MTM3W5.2]
MVIWGNGTGVLPGAYTLLLRHYASHGFIVVAANTPRATSRSPCAAASTSSRTSTPTPPASSTARWTWTGSDPRDTPRGIGRDQRRRRPRVDTVVAIQPGPLNDVDLIDEPVLFLAGQFDAIVWPILVKGMYNDADHVPAEYAELRGATHFGTGISGGDMRAPSTAWLRYWLMDDANARAEFFGPNCGFCSDSRQFSDFKRNGLAGQIPG